MKKSTLLLLAALTWACGVHGARAAILQVQHVVMVVQENRTPDNLFHGLKALEPAADLANSGIDSRGRRILLTPIPLANDYDLNHTHSPAFVTQYDGGKLDGADLVGCGITVSGGPKTCPPYPQFKYVDPKDVEPYLTMAKRYGFANRMFQSNQGPSFVAHQFILSGTSQVTATSPEFAAEDPLYEAEGKAGCCCTARPDQRVAIIGPSGVENGYVYPCFEHQTLIDVLNRHRPPITWRYYTPSPNSIWTAPDAIRHLCLPANQACTEKIWTNGSIDMNPADILRDIATGNLQQVSWVIPTGLESDHPGHNDGSGPSWVASIVNAIGNSSYWKNTVILVTWDDWGGFYDHVAPAIQRKFGYYEDGFRVPLLVISAYAKAHYISEMTHDFGSFHRLIEKVFGLPLIPPGDFADSRADDLGDFFDFNALPRKFETIPAPLGASFFLNDKRPVTDPDDD